MGERTQRGAPTVAGIVWRERGFACTLSLRQSRALQEWFRKGAKTRVYGRRLQAVERFARSFSPLATCRPSRAARHDGGLESNASSAWRGHSEAPNAAAFADGDGDSSSSRPSSARLATPLAAKRTELYERSLGEHAADAVRPSLRAAAATRAIIARH